MNRSLTDTFQTVPKSRERQEKEDFIGQEVQSHTPIRGSVCTDLFIYSFIIIIQLFS